jgi:PAS domain-containing protein
MTAWDEPSERNCYLEFHVTRLLRSFTHWTGKTLFDTSLPAVEQARQLFNALFVVLSHDTGSVLNYANRAGLNLFELTWEELITLPSRQTAEPSEQAERERLLAIVAGQGYIDNYRGVRVAKSGRRFLIEQATVWNLLDEKGKYYGQAAMFSKWIWL